MEFHGKPLHGIIEFLAADRLAVDHGDGLGHGGDSLFYERKT
jgi:hypothetical protein